MKQYSIGAIAKLTGLTVHNLRVWEKRHSAVETQRSDSGRRIYDENALERLRLLKACVDNGFTIGAIAGLSTPELEDIMSDFDSVAPTPSKQTGLDIVTVGTEPVALVNHINGFPFEVNHVTQYDTIDEFTANMGSDTIDLLLLEQASLTADETKNLAQVLKHANARHTILFYRYSRQQDVAYLQSLHVHCMKAPVDRTALHELINRLLQTPITEPTLDIGKARIPERRFSDVALLKAANLSSSIDCECPQHLSELIKAMISFEFYSADCENKDQASYDLHHHIYERTAQARAIMEDLLTSVLLQEGIDLSRVNH